MNIRWFADCRLLGKWPAPGGTNPADTRISGADTRKLACHSVADEVAGRRLRPRGHVQRFRGGSVARRRRAAGRPANHARATRQTAWQVRRDALRVVRTPAPGP